MLPIPEGPQLNFRAHSYSCGHYMFFVNIRKLVKGGPGKEGYLAGSRREKERKTKKKRKKMD